MVLHKTQRYKGIEIPHFSQSADILVPFYALRHAPHRSRLPCPLPISHSNIKTSCVSKEGIETRNAVRSEDWQGEYIHIGYHKYTVL
jgi:hypothetical protein